MLQGPYRQLGNSTLVMTQTSVFPSSHSLNRTGSAEAFTEVVTLSDLQQAAQGAHDKQSQAFFQGAALNLEEAQRLVDSGDISLKTFRYPGNVGRMAAMFEAAVLGLGRMADEQPKVMFRDGPAL